jgi:hypothetical protein
MANRSTELTYCKGTLLVKRLSKSDAKCLRTMLHLYGDNLRADIQYLEVFKTTFAFPASRYCASAREVVLQTVDVESFRWS